MLQERGKERMRGGFMEVVCGFGLEIRIGFEDQSWRQAFPGGR